MKKNKKSIVFLIIIFTIIFTFYFRNKFLVEENVYVVSKEEINDKQDIMIDKSSNENIIETEKVDLNKDVNTNMITIYISGEVKKPGVVTLESNKRLADAIKELGGTTADADLNKINMALKIKDEEHYIIPKIGEEIVNNESTINENTFSENNNKKININLAEINELEELPGVGEATANKIIKYRDENGSFKSIEEIKNVNGIGDKKYEDLKDLISINWYNNK